LYAFLVGQQPLTKKGLWFASTLFFGPAFEESRIGKGKAAGSDTGGFVV
jgi:hypothetical protein